VSGQYFSRRRRDWLENIEGILFVIGGIAGVIYLLIAGYELAASGAFLKLGINVALILIVTPLVIRLKMPFAIFLIVFLGVALSLVHFYI
jgi:lantibiotic modifying enzyme